MTKFYLTWSFVEHFVRGVMKCWYCACFLLSCMSGGEELMSLLIEMNEFFAVKEVSCDVRCM